MNELLVLCYHAVSPRWAAAVSVTPDALERQLARLLRAGWRASTFTDAVCRPIRGRTVVVTFDDAFASVKRLALPILSELGMTGTVFAPSDYISRGAPLAWAGMDGWAHGPEAGELEPMTWDDLRELAELGWEIGSHTRTHPRLTTLAPDALDQELALSRAECAERLARPVSSIAYPYGDVDARVVARAQAAGYLAGAALEWPRRSSGPLRHPRVGVYHGDSPARFRVKTVRWVRSRRAAGLLARLP